MKVIISHDVDHLTATEHIRDLYITKEFVVRSIIEILLKQITLKEYIYRLNRIIKNKLHNLENLILFDKKNNIPSTFFIGVNKGLGLSYPISFSKKWIKIIQSEGFDVGVHGINFSDFHGIKKEYTLFKELSNISTFGIRMHYLRLMQNTLEWLNKSGYLFDSTLRIRKNPYKIDNMWEFPIHLTEIEIFYPGTKWINCNLSQAKKKTIKIVKQLEDKGILYMIFSFHDVYFSDAYSQIKNWYIWFIEWMQSKGYEFIGYKDAIKELERGQTRL